MELKFWIWKKNKIASQWKTHAPRRFLYLREKSLWCEGGGGEEKVHLLTHATARGVGKKIQLLRKLKWSNITFEICDTQ